MEEESYTNDDGYSSNSSSDKSIKMMSFRTLSSKDTKHNSKIQVTFSGNELVDDDDVILVDKSKFGQVLRNLMSNAIKFTPNNGTIILCIRYVPDEIDSVVGMKKDIKDKSVSQKGRLVIEIQDSGAGISTDIQTRLFHQQNQFNPGELRSGEGLTGGLGLWISKCFVDMHNGHISVRSDGKDKGSTFRLEIPMNVLLICIMDISVCVPMGKIKDLLFV